MSHIFPLPPLTLHSPAITISLQFHKFTISFVTFLMLFIFLEWLLLFSTSKSLPLLSVLRLITKVTYSVRSSMIFFGVLLWVSIATCISVGYRTYHIILYLFERRLPFHKTMIHKTMLPPSWPCSRLWLQL